MSQHTTAPGHGGYQFFMHGCRVCLNSSPTSSCVWSAAAMLALLNASQAAQTCVPRGGRRSTCWADSMRGASGEGSGQVPGMSDDTHEWLPVNTRPVNRDSRALAKASSVHGARPIFCSGSCTRPASNRAEAGTHSYSRFVLPSPRSTMHRRSSSSFSRSSLLRISSRLAD